MIFSLEALEARFGDSLLLHYGSADDPRLMVIDGGPPGVYRRSLKPRLDEVKAALTPEDPLPLELVMVSHLDSDHVQGIVELTTELADKLEEQEPRPYEIKGLWHNTFDDVVGNSDTEWIARLTSTVPPIKRDGSTMTGPGIAVVASVPQGQAVRDQAKKLQVDVNQPFAGLVAAETAEAKTVDFDGGLRLTVIGPSRMRIDKLHEEWDEVLQKKAEDSDEALAQAAEYIDESVFNLSSIVAIATAGDRSMLLTGDARGDDILGGLESAGLLQEGTMHVDILKLPHHGSDRNVETDFFRQITADHYVVSGNGDHGNPEPAALKMISDARSDDDFTIHLTNEVDNVLDLFETERVSGRSYGVTFRADDALSLRVDLGDPPNE